MPEQPTMLTTHEVIARLAVSDDTALRIMRPTAGALRIKTGARTLYGMPVKVFESFIAHKSAPVKKGGKQ